ncbi:hotdog fold thioesterase [Flammeovirga yaeyamensis]|uniref:Hotdog fold thioesterase n=2 Tax=Flammeovirga yaeyamensis TaxID=367791 RepID=A0AAX1N5E3_9BACT|nr:hotdog fold thioesterase [Flammeovirga yaeyamensis]QWG01083.1 hotdog fold thioesterase [Flammeovirga yaeyamensis]
MFNNKVTIKSLNKLRNNMVGHVGIEFLEASEGFIKGVMPVDDRTKQPFGLLHGGASVVLAETLCSVGAMLHIDAENQVAVGQEINANHIKSAKEGVVYGEARAIHLGKNTHVWETKIIDEADNLICISRMTVAIIPKKNKG